MPRSRSLVGWSPTWSSLGRCPSSCSAWGSSPSPPVHRVQRPRAQGRLALGTRGDDRRRSARGAALGPGPRPGARRTRFHHVAQLQPGDAELTGHLIRHDDLTHASIVERMDADLTSLSERPGPRSLGSHTLAGRISPRSQVAGPPCLRAPRPHRAARVRSRSLGAARARYSFRRAAKARTRFRRGRSERSRSAPLADRPNATGHRLGPLLDRPAE